MIQALTRAKSTGQYWAWPIARPSHVKTIRKIRSATYIRALLIMSEEYWCHFLHTLKRVPFSWFHMMLPHLSTVVGKEYRLTILAIGRRWPCATPTHATLWNNGILPRPIPPAGRHVVAYKMLQFKMRAPKMQKFFCLPSLATITDGWCFIRNLNIIAESRDIIVTYYM